MCLYTKRSYTASKDIKVYKVVHTIGEDYAITPYRLTKIKLNEEFVASPAKVDISKVDDDIYKIDGGAIHCFIWPEFTRGICLEAYIPKGTEYWLGIDNCTIATKKIVITDKIIKPDDGAGMDEEMALDIYSEAPKNSKGVKIGSFLLLDSFVGPAIAGSIPTDELRGIVVGFDGDKPKIADIFNIIYTKRLDLFSDTLFNKSIPISYDAINDMNGFENTNAWKRTCVKRDEEPDAYFAISNLSKNHYIPALGEMELIWSNILYIAAGCSIAGISCPFNMSLRPWWTSTEASDCMSWVSTVIEEGSTSEYYTKNCRFNIVPFIDIANQEEHTSKKTFKKKLKAIWNVILHLKQELKNVFKNLKNFQIMT